MKLPYKKSFSCRFSSEAHGRLQEASKQLRVSSAELVRRAVDRAIAQWAKPAKENPPARRDLRS